MEDLKAILDINRALYKRFGLPLPIFDELITGFRWIMTADTDSHISLALRVEENISPEQYAKIAAELYGKPVDVCIEILLERRSPQLRNLIVSLSSLMSKPLNTAELLAKRGIVRTEGLQFRYQTEGKKVGLIGFGVYINRFLNRCKEFHVFDLRKPEAILSYRYKNGLQRFPEGIQWHLGHNAADFCDILSTLDIIIMSGSTIVNNSYTALRQAGTNAEIVGLYGPSCELCPDYFFEQGYNYMFSTSVRDKETYLKTALGAEQTYREFDYMDIYELERKRVSLN